MNNYYNYQNYINQAKPKMNFSSSNYMSDSKQMLEQNIMPNNDIDDKKAGLYSPYEGFIRGNMFKALYDPYKINVPYEIRPMNEQADMLTAIDSLCFAMIDLNLYLDNHPNDGNLINLYNEYRKQNEEIKKEYESKFGPLVTDSIAMKTIPWSWDDKPWPWENI